MKKFLALVLIALAPLFCSAQVSTLVHSSAYEAGHVVKTTPGVLVALSGYNSKASAQFIQVHDASAVPSDVVSGVAEISTVDTTGITAANLANTFFTLSGASGNFYVWFNLDAGGTDPAIAGKSGIEVAITTGETVGDLATAIASAIDAIADFGASPSTNVVTITDAATGARTDIADGTAATGLALAVSQQGVTAISAAVPLITITVAATSNFTITLPPEGVYCGTGISVCNSSTGPTKTAGSADVFFTAVYR